MFAELVSPGIETIQPKGRDCTPVGRVPIKANCDDGWTPIWP